MKNWIKLLLVVVFSLIVLLIFDYFSSSFNLIFLADKSSEIVIHGNPVLEDKLKLG
jgi:hypothetical protein